jgi:hypothetical protein
MDLIVPEKLRLVPGQSVQALFYPDPKLPREIGFFVRSARGLIKPGADFEIRRRAGLIRFNDVLLVLTMLKVDGEPDELFDIWWNYYAPEGSEYFEKTATQERITIHFYNEDGMGFLMEKENSFRKFFKSLPVLIKKNNRWTQIEFDRAVRGFCAQSYPKENLWEMIDIRSETEAISAPPKTDEYQGCIPENLRPLYAYVPNEGHCIKVIPSSMEQDAILGAPEDFLYPAPVKTVLRCGVRWVKGYPVAPIPFIPGHGLVAPPEDKEQ